MLDALAGARATFFPLSPRAVAYPDLIARIRAEGHAIGLHGWDHLKHPESDRDSVAADTDRALDVLDPAPAWWRLPYGMAAPFSAGLAADRGLAVAGWTDDTHDWRGDDCTTMRAALGALHDGAVVLMHDALGPGVRRADCAETVALTRRLIAEGHGSVTLDELGAVPSGRPG